MTAESPPTGASLTLTGIRRHPIKSCRAEMLTSAVVEPWGLAGDRRWMLVDDQGTTVTARKFAHLLLVTPFLVDEGLLLTAPRMDSLSIPVPDGTDLIKVNVWGEPFDASPAAAVASSWFSAVVKRPVTLVYLDDPTRRPTNPERSYDTDRVSFADGYPLLLATEESLAALNGWIAEGPRAADGPLPMGRFRPNLVVSGASAWDEDAWRRIRIGSSTFRSVKACDRCAMTLVNPSTAQKTKEPLFSLARHRQWDHKTWFAVNLIPDEPGGELHVGDRLDILEQVEDHEPQR